MKSIILTLILVVASSVLVCAGDISTVDGNILCKRFNSVWANGIPPKLRFTWTTRAEPTSRSNGHGYLTPKMALQLATKLGGDGEMVHLVTDLPKNLWERVKALRGYLEGLKA
jgi:hypothetical protein